MNRMSKKLNKKGFTLAELLIVVAIIAVLVVVSVPIFSSKLEKAREAADVANMRAAKAAAASMYLSGEMELGETYYYDAAEGQLSKSADKISAYGQGTKADGKTVYKNYESDGVDYTNDIITVKVTEGSDSQIDVEVKWTPKS
ncbi:prepilin-type N-terminal cleavage/methylation domain-containing protein [Enterocloster lavalensis]|uniref:prepilin-type N-terminal cleavage/methylation domain-containing protein n=1 Tax=Enterocloster lavalensis TaxID=460384 RepID=UPI001D090A70|nr:prepilin-type N-terminal cleavage/methylation domain-containing protein [Enterocloster lavalensis]MCB6343924.1 prepilin-type N-terminal cleavage/methylation domain-containing protein [Enterocloster lavalensis]